MNGPHDGLLRAEALSRRFGGLAAVEAVSLTLRQGEVHAVIGTNGAGKSTLVNLLSGELRADHGRVWLADQEVTQWPQPRRARAGLGRSYQRSSLFPQFSVLENCRLAAQAAHPRPLALWASARHDARCLARAHEVLRIVGLHDEAARTAHTLSHGQKRQLEIAMCLAPQPRVLLLDEPLAGMGPEETERMLALLQQLKATQAILLIEHDMDAVFRTAERITVMVNGQVIASGTPEAIRQNEAVRSAYLGQEFA